MLQWVAMPSSGEPPNPEIIPMSPALACRFFTTRAYWEAHYKGLVPSFLIFVFLGL